MRRWGWILLIALLLWQVTPGAAWAYSYGKPDEEAIAEAYEKAAAALGRNPPDYRTAEEAFRQVKGEMVQHAEIGPELAGAVERHLKERQREKVLYYWRQVLVRNIERRLNNLRQNFDDYAQAKILLAKAHGTYEVLSVDLKQRNPALAERLEAEFQKALTALGNPGLFGVGKKPSDPGQFDRSARTIVSELEKVYIPSDEQVASGGKGHVSAPLGEGEEPEGESPLAKWLPLAVILLAVIGSVLLFFYLGRRKRGT